MNLHSTRTWYSAILALFAGLAVNLCSAGPAEDVESARVMLRKFEGTGDPAPLQAIDENYLSGKWQMRSEVPPEELLYPGAGLIAEFHRLFYLGMEVFAAIDARDTVLAAAYTNEDEMALYRDFDFGRLAKLIPSVGGWKFDAARLDLLDAELIRDAEAREEFIMKRERYLHAENIKKQRRELDYYYDGWRGRLGSIIKLTPEPDRPELIRAVMKNVKREGIRALLIPGYVPASTPSVAETPRQNDTSSPKPDPRQPGTNGSARTADLSGKTHGTATRPDETRNSPNWWLIGVGVAAVAAGLSVYFVRRRST